MSAARRSEFELRAGGARLFAWTLAAPNPRARVLLVHGLGEHSGRYEELVEYFAERGFDVAGFDQRGHGRSSGKRGDAGLDDLLDDLDRIAAESDARLPPAPCFTYGHSLGGLLVLLWVLRRRPALAGAIAAAPALRPVPAPPRWKVCVARLLRRVAPSFTMSNGIDKDAVSRDPSARARYRGDPLVHRRISVRLGLDVLAAGRELLAHDTVAPLPILLLQGDADRLTSCDASRELARRVTGIELRVWPGLFHELHHEPERGEVFAQVADWIAQRAAISAAPAT